MCFIRCTLTISCDCHFKSHPIWPLLLQMCWKMVMHTHRPVPDGADTLLCGSHFSSYVSQDIFQFNDARKTRAVPRAYFLTFPIFQAISPVHSRSHITKWCCVEVLHGCLLRFSKCLEKPVNKWLHPRLKDQNTCVGVFFHHTLFLFK